MGRAGRRDKVPAVEGAGSLFANQGLKNSVSRKSMQTRDCSDATETPKEDVAISVSCLGEDMTEVLKTAGGRRI